MRGKSSHIQSRWEHFLSPHVHHPGYSLTGKASCKAAYIAGHCLCPCDHIFYFLPSPHLSHWSSHPLLAGKASGQDPSYFTFPLTLTPKQQ